MEKIIILSDKPRRSHRLAVYLKTQFPECDIITALMKPETPEEHDHEFSSTHELTLKKDIDLG
jgi:hypothetical protein